MTSLTSWNFEDTFGNLEPDHLNFWSISVNITRFD